MANHHDLADLVLARRREAGRWLESEMLKMRVAFGDRAVAAAVQLAQQAEERERISIEGERRLRQRDLVTARWAQRLRARRDHDHDERPLGPVLPPGWR
jgi:hypothetical protein